MRIVVLVRIRPVRLEGLSIWKPLTTLKVGSRAYIGLAGC